MKNYIFTERAHFMCPNMHFGILAVIKAEYDEQKFLQSIHALQKAHPFLQSLIAEEEGTGKYYYQKQDSLTIPVTIKKDAELWQQDYEEISAAGWNVMEESLLRTAVYPGEETFRILFITHHLLCDGRGLLQLTEEFAECYTGRKEPAFAEECLIRGLEDLPPGSDLSFVSRIIVSDANRRWKKAGDRVEYAQYREFEKEYIKENRKKCEAATISGKDLDEIKKTCKDNAVSVNDYLIARMMVEENTSKVVIAADIRNQVKCYRPGALGNYSTAFSIVLKKKGKDIWSAAKAVSAIVNDICTHPQKEMLVLACYIHMQSELIDAVAISSLGNFRSEAGSFVGKNMFGYEARNNHCITNLGRIQSESIEEALFIPPASPANEMTWGVLTVNDKMSIIKVS